jgi:anthranilate phosphoribosyltransferase
VITDAIAELTRGEDLTELEAHEAMMEVMGGEATQAQIAGFLVALRMKGETPEEITGCARAMRAHVTAVEVDRADLLDVVGTGGDGAHTFNISTTTALVATAAGATVAKHGNRAMSSRTGTADVLEQLGVRLDLSPAEVAECIETVGFGFMFAQVHHPAMRHAAPVRRELGVRTVFNLLGPLTNPAGARRALIGVYADSLVEPIARVLAALGTDHAFVVHGSGGMDEINPVGPAVVAEVRGEHVEVREMEPRDMGIERVTAEDLRGGDAARNADLLRAVLAGETGPRRETVVLNAGFALVAAGVAGDVPEGIGRAREAIDSGAAAARLDGLVEFTQTRGAQPA